MGDFNLAPKIRGKRCGQPREVHALPRCDLSSTGESVVEQKVPSPLIFRHLHATPKMAQ